MIGTSVAEELRPAFVDQSCAPDRELFQGGIRAPWCNAIQVTCKYAESFGAHVVSSNDGVSGPPERDTVRRLDVT